MRVSRAKLPTALPFIRYGRIQRSRYSGQALVQAPGNEVKTKIRNGIASPIDILITYPPRPEHGSPIILALGHGNRQCEHDEHTYTQALSWSTNATIVQPSYEVTRQWPYPSSLHMTLRVLDWISQNLLRTEPGAPKGRLGVCGGGVSGSLATMLALTECNPTKSCTIRAAAVNNPILDWTDIFPLGRDMVSGDLLGRDSNVFEEENVTSSSKWDGSVDCLLDLRREIFRKAPDFFDPFASPLLFFRTPHFDLPYSFYGSMSPKLQEEALPAVINRKRTYYRVHPPLRSGLTLPHMRITVSQDFPLAHQAAELVHFMRRSFQRDKEQSRNFSEQAIEERFTAHEVEENDVWDQRSVTEMGQWLGEILRKDS